MDSGQLDLGDVGLGTVYYPITLSCSVTVQPAADLTADGQGYHQLGSHMLILMNSYSHRWELLLLLLHLFIRNYVQPTAYNKDVIPSRGFLVTNHKSECKVA